MNKPIQASDVVHIKITGINHPKNWYAPYVRTGRIFKAVRQELDNGEIVYCTFFEGLMSNIDGTWWTYEDCLRASYVTLDNAEIVAI